MGEELAYTLDEAWDSIFTVKTALGKEHPDYKRLEAIQGDLALIACNVTAGIETKEKLIVTPITTSL